MLQHIATYRNISRHIATYRDISQYIATYRNRVLKRMQRVVPNNVKRCCVEMLRAFGQALSIKLHFRVQFELNKRE